MKAISPESKAATNDYDSKQIYSTVYINKRMWPEISAFGNTPQKKSDPATDLYFFMRAEKKMVSFLLLF